MSCLKKISAVVAFFLLFVFLSCSESVSAVRCGKSLPSSYDLRDVDGHCYVTPVKSQMVQGEWWNNVGLCWAFASLASFESNLLMQGITHDPESISSNFSPWHLGNFNGYNNPLYEFNSQIIPIANPPVPVAYNPLEGQGWGGTPINTIDYLSFARGVVPEYLAPVPLDEMKNHETLAPPFEKLPAYYMLRAGLIYYAENYATAEEYRTVVKTAIVNHGPVATFMYLGIGDFPGQSGQTFWRDDNFTDYYCDNEEFAGLGVHSVAVIGWDDARVISGAPGPGAWLIKDSLGTDVHDRGYLWISFYDTVFLKEPMYGAVLIADNGKGYAKTRYQTHRGALSKLPIEGALVWEYLSEGFNDYGLDSWGAGRFTARKDDILKAVGLVTVNRNENVSIRVYGCWNEAENHPDDLLLSDNILVEEIGYHVIDLSYAVRLQKGKEFVIAVGFSARPGGKEPLVVVQDENYPPLPDTTYMASFDHDSGWGKWVDCAGLNGGSAFYIQGITEDKTEVADSSCFISAIALDSPFERYVKTLREFRDKFMLTNMAGRAFARWYYMHSPKYSEAIANNCLLKGSARIMLMPVCGVALVAIRGLVPYIFMGIGIMFMVLNKRQKVG